MCIRDSNQVIYISLDNSIGNIINMPDKIIPACVFSNKSPQFCIFYGYFFNPGALVNNFLKFLPVKVFSSAKNMINFHLVEIILYSLYESVKSAFCGIRNI